MESLQKTTEVENGENPGEKKGYGKENMFLKLITQREI